MMYFCKIKYPLPLFQCQRFLPRYIFVFQGCLYSFQKQLFRSIHTILFFLPECLQLQFLVYYYILGFFHLIQAHVIRSTTCYNHQTEKHPIVYQETIQNLEHIILKKYSCLFSKERIG